MPRIIRILNRLAVGGPVLNAAYLTKYLAPEFETLLVVGEKEDHEQSAAYLTDALGIECVTIAGMGRSISPASDFGAYLKLRKLIREYKPDIVHTHAAKPGAIGRLAASAERVPVILHTFHGHVFHSYFSTSKTKFIIGTERLLARRTDAIVTISEQQRKELAEDFRIAPPGKFRVIPLGFDLDKFTTGREEKRSRFRREFGITDDEIAIGIVGRLVPVKNHELFLEALRHVLDKSTRKVKAFIIGDGETRARLEARAKELRISFNAVPAPADQLVFTSWRSDVDVVYAALDIVALTSVNEGTPVSLIEAQASNKPIVSTRVGGIADIVAEGKTGLLADVKDTATFCGHLLQLVEDNSLRQRLGQNSSQHVLERFSYQRLMNDTSSLYRGLLQSKGKRPVNK
ncbi:MAG TPA: glycosyltransferase [Flavisolibacter sp.]|jgi:glycosyltransferase involved in cell wall biosynthesis|nr:glycosyltransferase [Flavisolibacter sp.]